MSYVLTVGKFTDIQSATLYYSYNFHILSQSQYFPPKAALFENLDLNRFVVVRDKLFLPSQHEKPYITPSYCKKLAKEDVAIVLDDPRTRVDPITAYCLRIILEKEAARW